MKDVRTGRMLLLAIAAAFAATVSVAHGMEVYFLRHGETTWNRAKILQGSVPYTDLTYRGVRMAEETAKGMLSAGLRFDRVYTSPYLRARRTAEIVAEGGAGPKPVADERIREMCFGKYEGVRYGKGDYPDDNLRSFFENGDFASAGIDQSRVMVATFNRRALAYFKERHPSIRRVGHFSFNREKAGKDGMRKMALAFRDEYGLYGLNMPVKGFKTEPDDVAFLRENGIWVSLWFVQDERSAAFYRPAMPDAFVTDCVSNVRKVWRNGK